MNHLPLTGTVKAIWKQSGNVSSSFLRVVSVKLVPQLHHVAAGRRIKCSEGCECTNCSNTQSTTHTAIGNREDTLMELSLEENFTENREQFLDDEVDEIMDYISLVTTHSVKNTMIAVKQTRAVKWKIRVKQNIIVMWKITVNILTKVLKCTH